MRASPVLLALVLLPGCASTPPLDLPAAASAPPLTTFVLYHGPTSIVVDSLRLSNDTVYARQLPVRPGGSRELTVLPRVEVDSIRRAHPDRSALALATLPFAIAIGLMVLFRASYGSD